ncbi:hypothetical protein MVES1_000303 [Malassezia vespertilionis]|uniref:AN1-type domain-containing protein n=1 Tax=Malassezia vespertilionis TaxID=2020962 RepID=A0A2N1JGX0_9BASI|nr:uncharacterized protein MVES1_000303 [Malassezia vespertilionis]PKI85793.1 hypothetical protein MVES_000284 [Malassezia vespertilionis]WFD04978.1 hypothetical protein MVES1_000303 [Malassezia vespertilionis]
MSMLSGEHCALASCNRVSFLPLRCPSCAVLHCELHVQPAEHGCTALRHAPSKASESHTKRVVCARRGCCAFTLHVAPHTSAVTHDAPSCERCGAFFCMQHRSAPAHGCTALPPRTAGQQRMDEKEARKARAAAILAKTFPKHSAHVTY